MPAKHTYDEVAEMFEARGFILLSKEYKDALTPLDYVCSCGNQAKIRLSKLKIGQKCAACGLGSGNRINLEFAQWWYKREGCELLATEFHGSGSTVKLPYICSCGRPAATSWKSFRQGSRCEYCAKVKMGAHVQDRKSVV